MLKPRFFTGIQATGTLTLGNYFGLIHHILEIQDRYEVIIMIADLHALTLPQKGIDYQKNSQEIAALLYACGLKEENCKIFIQSQIKEHLELSFLLSPHVTVGILSNMIQYKEKKRSQETGNLSLLAYPVLMAADIFLYDVDLVIVGQDQTQHLELTTNIAQKFNNFYGKKLLKVPHFTIPSLGAKIMGLNHPNRKMSKSENDYLALRDEPQTIKKKIAKAVTDSENKIYFDPQKKPGISNLLTIYALLTGCQITEAEEKLTGLDYQQFKRQLTELIINKTTTIQKKYDYQREKITNLLKKNTEYLRLQAGKKLISLKKELKIT